MPGRLIAIGDIHGCHKEFADLLEKLDLRKEDRLILLGDLINRGPDSGKVVELAREYATASLLGNHELRHLNYRRTDDPTHLKKYDYATMEQMRPKDWDYLETMKLTYEDESLGVVFVHAGFLPDRPWAKQPARIVTRIQVVDPAGEPASDRRHLSRPIGQNSGWVRLSSSTAIPRALRWLGLNGPWASTRPACSEAASPPIFYPKSGLCR